MLRSVLIWLFRLVAAIGVSVAVLAMMAILALRDLA